MAQELIVHTDPRGRLYEVVRRDDPNYTHKDQLYFYIGETLYRSKNPKEALPYYQRLLTEFEKSEYVKRAQARITELKR